MSDRRREREHGSSGCPARAEASAAVRLYWSSHDRLWALTAVAALGLVVAATMAVFGLPPVDLHGPLHRMGIMDPFCGGTRATRLTAQGHLATAWRYNPLGIIAVAVGAAALMRLAAGVLTHRWLNVAITWTPGRKRVVVSTVVVLIVLLEIRQQGRADLLLQTY